MEKIIIITEMEQKLNTCTSLLEVAKVYCEHNYDKSNEINTISSIIDVILKNQNDIIGNLDKLATN